MNWITIENRSTLEKREHYVYGYYVDNKPIYIGLGKNRRAWDHLQPHKRLKDRPDIYFYRKINKLLENNIMPEIKILRKNLSEREAEITEEVLIELCGRKFNKTGILYNIATGGKGIKGIPFTEERKRKMSINSKKYSETPEAIKFFLENVQNTRNKKVYQYDLKGNFITEFTSINNASKSINKVASCITAALNNKRKSAGGFMWTDYKQDDFINEYEINKVNKNNQILAINKKTKEEKLYKNIEECSEYLNINKYHINRILREETSRKSTGGFIFKYHII